VFTNFCGHPIFNMTWQSPALSTESNAFVRSINTMSRSWFCSRHFSCTCLAVKIMSIVPHSVPCRKNYTLDRKMNDTDNTTSSITVQSLEKIVLRAPAIGAKTCCLFLFFFCHAPNPEHRAFKGCIVRTSIALPFIGRFRLGFKRFSEVAALVTCQ